jgi:hypothetical protein
MDGYKRMFGEFEIEQKVSVNIPNNDSDKDIIFNGKILGKATNNFTLARMWIVSLDEPLNEYTKSLKEKAVVILATYID